MSTVFLGVIVVTGALALVSLLQLVASWRADQGKPSPSGATVLLGSRMCLWCWSVAGLIKATDWATGGLDHIPQPVLMVVGFLTYATMFTAAGGVVIAAIGATLWVVKD